MTNHWVDIKNTDCVLMIGSNAAENHPMSFRWIEEARRIRKAKLIVVDPRISRSAAKADLYGRLRSGTDIAFIGGLINYILTYGKYNQDYVENYTNLAYMITTQYNSNLSAPFDGVFPGMSTYATSTSPKYDSSLWGYQAGTQGPGMDGTYPGLNYATPTQHSVIEILKSHFSRYTPDMVSSITGMAKEDFLKIAEEYAATGASNKSGTIMYAMGTTQHTYGTQNIRSYAILQMLLGNMGVAGGGINALRGESNVQGSTDMCLLFHILPGYLGMIDATCTGLGLETSPTTALKVDTVTNTASVAGVTGGNNMVVQTGTDLKALGVVAGDRVRNVTSDPTNWYTLECLVGTNDLRVKSKAGVPVAGATTWNNGDNLEIDSSSFIRGSTLATTYLGQKTPKAMAGTPDILGNERLSANWWQFYPKYMMSLLGAWWGSSTHYADNADTTPGGQYAYNFLPKIEKSTNYSHISIFEHINDLAASSPATPQMMMCWGQNPAVAGPQAVFERAQLAKLDTLVCVDLWETETAAFWKPDANGNALGTGTPTTGIGTTVYMLPAKASTEKEGSIVNSGRWMQWRYPGEHNGVHVQKGDCKADLDMINDLWLELKTLYAADNPTTVEAGLGIVEMAWGPGTLNDYGAQGTEADVKIVAKEVNGFALNNPGTTGASRGAQYSSFGALKADASTASGNWLYCGSWVEPSADVLAPQTGANAGNRAAKRVPVDNSASGIGLFSNWSWCWPINRRIIYNRASLNPQGGADPYVPWADDKWVVKRNYTATPNAWAPGGDVPDGGWAPEDYMAFIMKPEGAAHIWGPGRVDGPLPEHYEPAESPVDAHPFGAGHVFWNPMVINEDYIAAGTDFLQYNVTLGDNNTYPVIGTTFRLVEHWQAGAMTRNLPWLVELQPDMFCEMSEEFAAVLGVSNGDQVKVTTARNTTEPLFAVALVTKRFKPFTIMGNTVHQVGFPWHFGYRGLGQGSSANLLTLHIGDPNTRIPEYKAFQCKVEPA